MLVIELYVLNLIEKKSLKIIACHEVIIIGRSFYFIKRKHLIIEDIHVHARGGNIFDDRGFKVGKY